MVTTTVKIAYSVFRAYILPPNVVAGRETSAVGQAVFNTRKFLDYTKVATNSPFGITLYTISMLGSFIVVSLARAPNIFKAYNPAFNVTNLINEIFHDITTQTSQLIVINPDAYNALIDHLWNNSIKGQNAYNFLAELVSKCNHNIDLKALNEFIAAMEEANAVHDKSLLQKAGKMIKSVFDSLFPESLNWYGRIIFYPVLLLSFISILFQSVGIIGFTKSLLQLAVLVVSILLGQEYKQSNAEDIINNVYTQLFTGWLFVCNLIANLNTDFAQAIRNATEFAETIQKDDTNWKKVLTSKGFLVSGLFLILSVLAVGRLAKVSTASNLEKLFFKVPPSWVNFLSSLSAVTAVTALITTKLPSLARTINGNVPSLQELTTSMRGVLTLFYLGLLFDFIGNWVANLTAVATGMIDWIKENDATFDENHPNYSVVSTLVNIVSGLLSTMTNGVDVAYKREQFVYNVLEMKNYSITKRIAEWRRAYHQYERIPEGDLEAQTPEITKQPEEINPTQPIHDAEYEELVRTLIEDCDDPFGMAATTKLSPRASKTNTENKESKESDMLIPLLPFKNKTEAQSSKAQSMRVLKNSQQTLFPHRSSPNLRTPKTEENLIPAAVSPTNTYSADLA